MKSIMRTMHQIHTQNFVRQAHKYCNTKKKNTSLLADLIGVSWILPGHVEHVSDFLCQPDAGAAVGCDVDSRDAALAGHL